MNKIRSFFQRDPINKGRQINVDILKGISVIFMVICHSVMYTNNNDDSFWYFFADHCLGSFFGAAPGFMLAMGIGLVFSRKNDPKSIFIKGLKIFILGYVLNFFRLGIYCLIWQDYEWFVSTVLSTDILPFAGLSLMLIALAKKLKIKTIYLVLFSILTSSLCWLTYPLTTGNVALDLLLNVLVPFDIEDIYGFNIASWFIFVTVGMLFGEILQRAKDLDKLYKVILIPSILCLIGGTVFFLNGDTGIGFYGMTFPTALGFLGWCFTLLSAFYFLGKVLPKKIYDFFHTIAQNITIIYFTHWIFIGAILVFVIYGFETSFAFVYAYLLGIVLFVISYFISLLVRKIQLKFKKKNA